MVDVPQLWHGIKRVTGDPAARVDYVRLRKEISRSSGDRFIAYLVCLTSARGGRPLRDDSGFATLLSRAGYEVHRSYVPVRSADCGPRSEESTISVYSPAMLDAVVSLPEFDTLAVVSGAGGFIPIAEHAKTLGKDVVVYAFGRSPVRTESHGRGPGDLNPTLFGIADRFISLDASYAYDPHAVRTKQIARQAVRRRGVMV